MNSIFAPEAQPEGSQTCNVWKKAPPFRALKERHNLLPRLQRGDYGLTIPEVSSLATFCSPLHGETHFLNML